MKNRLSLFLVFLLCSAGIVLAQTPASITGVVVDDSDGEPIIGASVLVKGTTNGSPTDIDGRFTLHVGKLPVTLEVSYMGYVQQEVRVATAQKLTIRLKQDSKLLDEVVISTGYTNLSKAAYSGSASAVKGDKLKDVPALSFKDLLQGNATGVQFSSPSGQPGASTSVNIRGMGSINASNQPLYVIDGVPVRSGNVDPLSTDAGLDIMSTISSSDIESISVIKDAAAASLYGSRAANGVIIITTKKGKQGKPQVSLKADWGFSDFAMQYRPVMSGAERREYIYDALYRGQIRDNKSEADAKAYADEKVETYAPVPWCGYQDWDKILFRNGSHQNYEASLSGGTDKFKYYSSLGYTKQEGVTVSSGLERISGRLNVDYKATDKLTLGTNILFSNVNQNVYSEGTSYTSPFYSSRNCVVPSDPEYLEDGSWNRDFIRNSDRNPALSQTYDSKREYVTRAFNTIYGEYAFLKDLKFKTTLSYDYNIVKAKNWSDPRTSNGDDVNGEMSMYMYEYKKLVWKNQLTYKHTFAQYHNFDGLLGYEIDDSSSDYLHGSASNFAIPSKNALSNGMTTGSVSGSPSKQRIVSYLGYANYNYHSKYYLGASYRVDGSSRLYSKSRWGSFWSASGAWRIIEEGFMAPAKDWLTDLKLRVSYGVNGTLPSDSYPYMPLYSLTGGYNNNPGLYPSQLANYDLSWETNYNFNVGVDFELWSRVNVTLEYYTRTTKNLLMKRPISMTTGFSSWLMNVGSMRNHGVELEINATPVSVKDFKWATTFNLSANANKVLTLDGHQTEIKDGNQIHKIGMPYRTFYLIEFAGINTETGAPQFYTNTLDANGNYVKDITEKIAEANAIPLKKHAEPTAVGGFSNNLSYKWFDLNFMLSYQFGGYSYDSWASKTEHGGKDLEANIPTYYKDSWKKPGDVTQYEVFIESPSVSMQNVATDRRLHSTDFIRLKTVTFGVTLPKSWTNKVGLDKVRLYASANNLLTWAAYDYYDPESVRNGSAIWGTPPLKTVTFGFNINL